MRSTYERRTIGPPFTTASRSGTKTSAASRVRSSSALASAAPFSRRRFASPGTSVTSVSAGDPPSSPDEHDPRAVLAEAHELPLRTRARREALRPDVERLEQVRLCPRRSGP